MRTEIKNRITLLCVFILLVLQFINTLYDMSDLILSNRWNIILYVYVFLFISSLFFYLGLLSYGRLPCNIPWYGKNKVILFLGISLFSVICKYLSISIFDYYTFYGTAGILKAQLQYNYFSFFIILLLGSVFLFIPQRIGYIICMQLPFYLVSMLARVPDCASFFMRFQALWNVLLMFVIVWPILCHSNIMLGHWKIKNRKQLWLCFSVSIVVALLIHYFRL